MTKRQLIEEIRRHNPTAEEQFLERFDETSLKLYLDRLNAGEQRTLRIPREQSKPARLRRAS